MSDAAPETRSDWVYKRLKHAIVSGELPPGERLVAADLARRWALSPHAGVKPSINPADGWRRMALFLNPQQRVAILTGTARRLFRPVAGVP